MKSIPKLSLIFAALAALAAGNVATAAIPANGTYAIVNRATGKLLDSYGSQTGGDPARQYDKTRAAAQQWALTSGSGFWQLHTSSLLGTAMYLDSLGNVGNGTDCNLWSASGNINQKWTIVDLGNGYFKLKNQANGLFLDNLGSTVNGDNMKFWQDSTSFNQQWAFVVPGITFFSDRTYAGTASQEIVPGDYNTAQMVAKGCADNSADSLQLWWPTLSAECYDSGNLTGTPAFFSEDTPTMPGCANIMSSVRVRTSIPAGHVYRSAPGAWVAYRVSYLFGTWLLMHRGDNVQLSSSGAAKYTVRYETEYWVKSGAGINYPLVEVLSCTNVKYSTNGQSDPGTCTGTPLPWEDYWNLNGTVRWTDVEGNCAMNAALRDGGP